MGLIKTVGMPLVIVGITLYTNNTVMQRDIEQLTKSVNKLSSKVEKLNEKVVDLQIQLAMQSTINNQTMGTR